VILLFVSACVGSTVPNSGCLIFQPIHGSLADTEGTRLQVDEHNAVGEAVCGW